MDSATRGELEVEWTSLHVVEQSLHEWCKRHACCFASASRSTIDAMATQRRPHLLHSSSGNSTRVKEAAYCDSYVRDLI